MSFVHNSRFVRLEPPSACGVFRPEQSIGKRCGTSGERVGEYKSEGTSLQMFLESILAALPALMIPFKSPSTEERRYIRYAIRIQSAQ